MVTTTKVLVASYKILIDWVRGGLVWQDSDLFGRAGDNGNYWSSTPVSNGTQAYNLNFNGTGNINPSNNNNRQNSRSVRCLLLCPISAPEHHIIKKREQETPSRCLLLLCAYFATRTVT